MRPQIALLTVLATTFALPAAANQSGVSLDGHRRTQYTHSGSLPGDVSIGPPTSGDSIPECRETNCVSTRFDLALPAGAPSGKFVYVVTITDSFVRQVGHRQVDVILHDAQGGVVTRAALADPAANLVPLDPASTPERRRTHAYLVAPRLRPGSYELRLYNRGSLEMYYEATATWTANPPRRAR